jgi:hypothetical protein
MLATRPSTHHDKEGFCGHQQNRTTETRLIVVGGLVDSLLHAWGAKQLRQDSQQDSSSWCRLAVAGPGHACVFGA